MLRGPQAPKKNEMCPRSFIILPGYGHIQAARHNQRTIPSRHTLTRASSNSLRSIVKGLAAFEASTGQYMICANIRCEIFLTKYGVGPRSGGPQAPPKRYQTLPNAPVILCHVIEAFGSVWRCLGASGGQYTGSDPICGHVGNVHFWWSKADICIYI